jgi:hypothetical protein
VNEQIFVVRGEHVLSVDWPFIVSFFRPQEAKMTFEQELYNNFTFNTSKSYFITFPGDVSGVFSRLSPTLLQAIHTQSPD